MELPNGELTENYPSRSKIWSNSMRKTRQHSSRYGRKLFSLAFLIVSKSILIFTTQAHRSLVVSMTT
jgi:hypothetical protein